MRESTDVCQCCGGTGEVLAASDDSGFVKADGGHKSCESCLGTGFAYALSAKRFLMAHGDEETMERIRKAVQKIESQFKRPKGKRK